LTILPHGESGVGPARHDVRVLPATFDSLGVPAPLVATLAAAGITAAFPIQFVPVVRRVLEAAPPEGQRILFSPTLDNAVIAARGIHVEGIGLVIHADPPGGGQSHRARRGRGVKQVRVAGAGAAGANRSQQTCSHDGRADSQIVNSEGEGRWPSEP
jgi:hypothetical protein